MRTIGGKKSSLEHTPATPVKIPPTKIAELPAPRPPADYSGQGEVMATPESSSTTIKGQEFTVRKSGVF